MVQAMNSIAIIVLAAGKGTRMRSAAPKVLHRAAGRSLLGHVLTAAAALSPVRAIVVNGPGQADVADEALAHFPAASIVTQKERLGTGHAVSIALPALKKFSGTVMVLYGDTPLLSVETLQGLAAQVNAKTPFAVLGFEAANPTGYGRLLRNAAGSLTGIREELDASKKEKAIRLCNSGVIALDAGLLAKLLPLVGNKNAKGEYYLTDLVALAVKAKKRVALSVCPEAEVLGVNTRAQLAEVEAHFQQRLRARAMEGGATLVAPETVYFCADTVVGCDVVIEPHVVFGPKVVIGDNVQIRAFSHIEGAKIAAGATIGPFARLRPGADIAADAHIGNFVEIKKSRVEKGAKVNHLSYIGDARVGAKANIGAGTITCNYDGFAKHVTDIGAGAFIGSNSSLVAPVRIGDGAYVGSGSVITKDVPDNALALERGTQTIREGWAARFRALRQAVKAKIK